MSIQIRQKLSEQTLLEAIRGKEASIPRGWAISQVPYADIPDRAGLLRKILGDEKDDLKSRRLAAAALWRLNTAEAREALLAAATAADDPGLLAGVVKFLGRVGDQRALAAIEKSKGRGQGVLAERAAFAAALIAHRLGLPGNDLPVPRKFEALPPTDQRRIEFAPPSPEEAALFARCLEDEPYDIAVSMDSLLQIRCARNRWILAFTETLVAADAMAALRKQKSVVALLGSKSSEDGSYSVAFLFFSAPGRGGKQVVLLGHRTTGEQAWAGSIEAGDSGGLRFALHTAGRLGIVPIELEGVWQRGGKIATTKALSATRVTEKQTPVPIEAPAR